MKTFLDSRSKLFLLYGNLTDEYCSGDLIRRDLESYLVSLLKSRGYQYVIFFGVGGNKGAYCRDEESARFFFVNNQGLPPARKPTAEAPDQPKAADEQEKTDGGNSVADELDALLYNPGDLSKSDDGGDKKPKQPAPPPAEKKVCYAMRGQQLEEFAAQIHKLALDPANRMAVIYYNLLMGSNIPVGQLDDLLYQFQRTRTRSISLILAPEACRNLPALRESLHRLNLHAMFLDEDPDTNRFSLKTENCVYFGAPREDELANYLRRLAIIGTEDGNRIALRYDQLPKLASHLGHNAARAAEERRKGGSADVTLREIDEVLCDYIDSNTRDGQPIELTEEVLDAAWNLGKEIPAIEALNRPGWEAAYNLVSNVLQQHQKKHDKQENKKGLNDARRLKAQHGIGRLEIPERAAGEAERNIPHFVLMGNPGTGKSTIARLIGRVLFEAGILRSGHTIEVSKQNLTNNYVSGAEVETRNRIEEAEEGVLFIDEAPQLGTAQDGVQHEDVGRRIIEALVHNMTNPRYHFSLILAGYEGPMREMLKNGDPGFKSRFKDNFIVLDDYPPELLTRILTAKLEELGYQIDSRLTRTEEKDGQAYTPLGCMVKRLYDERDHTTFANVRTIETLAEKAVGSADGDLIRMEDFYQTIDESRIDESWFRPADLGSSFEKVREELDRRFVGMEKVKKQLEDIYLELKEAEENGKDPLSLPLRPILLAGNPGTGKTELAKLLPRLYFRFGLLGTPRLIQVSTADLVSSLSGESIKKTQAYIKRAQDSRAMLFLDEAHQLLDGHIDGDGIIKTFMAPLTDSEHPFLLCIAVYRHQVEELLNKDPGIKSRFHIIELEDYTGSELLEIFRRKMNAEGKSMTEETEDLLGQALDRYYLHRTLDDGNGRYVQNLLEDMNRQRRVRLNQAGVAYGNPEASVFQPQDIPAKLREGLRPHTERGVKAQLRELLEEFDREVVGMREVKKWLSDLALELEETHSRGSAVDTVTLRPIILAGNPGTGKTMIADIIPKIFAQFGLLHTEKGIHINASSLATSYAGGPQEQIKDYIKQAQKERALLFVDEAHQLLDMPYGGKGAVQAFMAPTTDKKHPFLACFAVYPERVDEFIGADPGARSRFRVLRIADYNGPELLEIFRRKLAQTGDTMTEETERLLAQLFEKSAAMADKRSGNGRMVERIFEEMGKCRRERCDKGNIAFGTPESRVFQAEDIPAEERRNLSAEGQKTLIERYQDMKRKLNSERVGTVQVKAVLEEKLDALIAREKFPKRAKSVIPGHYFFLGNPGTGKSTSVDFFTGCLYQMGLVRSPEAVKITASQLIGRFVGETETKTRERLENTIGRVLMIDEAYALAGNPDFGGDAYKTDAVNEIIAFLDREDVRKNTCVIFAGYPADLRRLYETNDGFRSRLKEIEFPDFTAEECEAILLSMLKEQGLTIDQQALVRIREQIRWMHGCEEFANGRTIRTYSELLCSRLEKRCSEHLDTYEEDDERAYTILPEDVPRDTLLPAALNL